MKITIELDPETLLAFQRTRDGLRWPAGVTGHRELAKQLIILATEAMAVSETQTTIWPVGRLDFRYWNEHERNAHNALSQAAAAQK